MKVMTLGQERCLKLTSLFTDELPDIFRQLWMRLWESRMGFSWNSTSTLPPPYNCYVTCKEYYIYLEAISPPKSIKLRKDCVSKLVSLPNIQQWDFFLIVNILTNTCICNPTRLLSLQKIEALNSIRTLRSEFYSHITQTEISEEYWRTCFDKLLNFLVVLDVDENYARSTLNKPVTEEITVGPALDNRQRQHAWLDSHFVGSNRNNELQLAGVTVGATFSMSQPKGPVLILTLQSCGGTRMDLVLPTINDHTRLVTGSADKIDNGISSGTVQPEKVNERWLLGLDDHSLQAEHCAVYYDSLLSAWMLQALAGPNTNSNSSYAIGSNSNVFLRQPITIRNNVQDVNPVKSVTSGTAVDLTKGCVIQVGQCVLKVLDIDLSCDINEMGCAVGGMQALSAVNRPPSPPPAMRITRSASSSSNNNILNTSSVNGGPKEVKLTDCNAEQLRKIEANKHAAELKRQQKLAAQCTSPVTSSSSSLASSSSRVTPATAIVKPVQSPSAPNLPPQSALMYGSPLPVRTSIPLVQVVSPTGQFMGTISDLSPEAKRKMDESHAAALAKRQKVMTK